MRRPRTTKVLLTGEVATFIYVKNLKQPMVLKISHDTGATEWMYWDNYAAEIA